MLYGRCYDVETVALTTCLIFKRKQNSISSIGKPSWQQLVGLLISICFA